MPVLVGGGWNAQLVHSLTGNQYMSEVYQNHKDKEDGFLYIMYSNELLWGN